MCSLLFGVYKFVPAVKRPINALYRIRIILPRALVYIWNIPSSRSFVVRTSTFFRHFHAFYLCPQFAFFCSLYFVPFSLVSPMTVFFSFGFVASICFTRIRWIFAIGHGRKKNENFINLKNFVFYVHYLILFV